MAWQDTHPDFAVPRAIQKLVDMGMIIDSTLPHDMSPNFDAVLRDGSVLTIWVDHPVMGKRAGQEMRYGLRIARPGRTIDAQTLMETDNSAQLLDEFKRILSEEGGPRMGYANGWRDMVYQYAGW